MKRSFKVLQIIKRRFSRRLSGNRKTRQFTAIPSGGRMNTETAWERNDQKSDLVR